MKKLIIAAVLLSSFQSNASLKVETYNMGLAHGFVNHAAERTPKLLEALGQSDSDVICLQEVWSLADRATVAKVLSEKYQDVYHTPVYQTTTSARPSCKPWELFGKGKFVSCMQSRCSDASGDEFTDCIVHKCGESLDRLKRDNRQCASALMAKVGKNPIVSMLQLINPFYRSGLYAYRGSNGLMLASKLPLKNKELVDFSDISTLNRRQALTAQIEYNGENVEVMCAHLAADLGVPYTGLSRNWADENYTQALRLLERARNASSAIVMGDFNCGLANAAGDLTDELPETCELLENHWEDPAKELNQCTYCSSNLLIAPGSTTNKFIDHVYLKGLKSSGVKRTRDEKIEIEVGKERIKSHLSDHYGIQVTID